MKKKLLYLVLLLFTSSSIIFAQNPNGYCSVSIQDSVDAEASRHIAVVPKIADSLAPQIDGKMDQIWFCSATPLSMQFRDVVDESKGYTATSDPNYMSDTRLLYDNNWLYVAVNVLHDDILTLDGTAGNQIDRVELMFQNTWGGRKDGTYNHCDENNWWWYYWEQDGDKKFIMPATKDFNLLYDDQDINNACAIPHPASFSIEAPGWLTLGVIKQVLFEVDTAELSDGTYRITYEMAFHLRNWLGYDDNTPAAIGHSFGLDVSVRDHDPEFNAQFNISDPENYGWCSPLVISKFTFGEELTLPDTCQPPIEETGGICDSDPILCSGSSTNISSFLDEEIRVYPNPANDFIQINTDSQISSFKIINLTGQEVMQGNDYASSINISNLENGIYYIKTYSKNKMTGITRFIKSNN